MARPTIYDQPMTAAERMWQFRMRKKLGIIRPPTPTIREQHAQHQQLLGKVALRNIYYVRAVMRASKRSGTFHEFEQVLRGISQRKYGRIGMEFLAEVARHGDADMQRAVCDQIKQAGAAAGRALWKELIRDGKHEELVGRHEDRRVRRRLGPRPWGDDPHCGMVW